MATKFVNLFLCLSLVIIILPIQQLNAQHISRKNLHAWPTASPPKIDGILDDQVWKDPLQINKLTASTRNYIYFEDTPMKYVSEGYFIQNSPNNLQKSSQKTKVQVAYDNYAIYISAQLYDTAPDSIRTNMGERDSGGNGGDFFIVSFDTYNTQQDTYEFVVSASGVQSDRIQGTSGWDGNWNEIWTSAVKVNEEGWAVEMEIPYRALRMPDGKEQIWGLNFGRVIARSGETSYWNAVDANKSGYVNQFGTLRGIYDVNPPIRLSLTPYISNVSIGQQGGQFAHTFSGGADIKVGLGQSFTLDVSLIPDFSQVQADNQVLNLSAYEVQFGEFRDFFTQGTTIFNKWDQFYSRRIGQNHNNPGDEVLRENEAFIYKPSDAPILNNTKLTGITEKGLGVGILNSITNETFAIIEDSTTGERREELADPVTNFNIISVEQALPNNSKIGVMNANVYRGEGFKSSNVTSTDFNFFDRTNTYRFRGFGALSQEFFPSEESENGQTQQKGYTQLGHRIDVGGGKVSGKWRYWATSNIESDTYNPNDMGYNSAVNKIGFYSNASYNQFEAGPFYQRYWLRVGYDENWLYNPRTFTSRKVWADGYFLFNNFWSMNVDSYIHPGISYDYFGPREHGYYFKEYMSHGGGFTINSDSRNLYTGSVRISYWARPEFSQLDNFISYNQTYRATDRFDLTHSVSWNNQRDEKGYVTTLHEDNGDVESVIYGNRDVKTFENNFTSKYYFNPKMSMKLRLRHYWRRVDYDEFFDLSTTGDLLTTDYTDLDENGEHTQNTNYNTFDMELSYSWEFLPGSFLTAMWRNELKSSNHNSEITFSDNMKEMWEEPQLNTLSIRLSYFLDYGQVKRML
ncbi:DUF5916 domain-containing protein [Flammeovirga sp. EKP202]|uniref:DUF5916 domain-containing protein n=1 Tax=Flammeovirga sp. EKP202 TaxID=2770592 RepID=UPI00165F4D6C|nr:DUF5916 domain-containing protein [Flammeovirga sp. EKP202]MBD0401899.1 carbohydrate binding family 9 domain-containing protein [Flammeovirga sp. EKP202]